MIRSLRLRNWRSYEDLDLRLDPGTTFVVAPNGVGKTSLVYGLAWGVFGRHSRVEPKESIRAGAHSAEVELDVEFPDGRGLSISRTVKRRGVPTATYQMDGTRLTESSALDEMEQAFGLEIQAAGRLSMMLGGGHVAASDALNLESHLHQAFGVAHLLDATKTAQSVAREARKARERLRSTTRRRVENRTALEEQVAALEEEIARLGRRSLDLERVRDDAAAQRSRVERYLALTGESERYEQQRSRLMVAIENTLGHSVSFDSSQDTASALRSELEESEKEILEATERAVTARAVISAAEQAVNLLGGDDATCPTCMRPLPHGERASAMSVHGTRRKAAEAEVSRLERDRSVRRTRAREVSQLLAQWEALRPPSLQVEDVDVPTREEAEARYRQASAGLDEHNRRLGGLQSQLKTLKAQIDSDDEVRREDRKLRLAYRREAAALAGEKVLRAAADRVIKSRIEPMASELRSRWKHLFSNNGLVFKPDGSITRFREGEELRWDSLSGGERTWARIVTHLIVMGTTTSLPFAWFDEPLEHLDPQLRHAVAATLATATRGGSPRQLLVTTYEHGIAQQLAEDTEGAGIVAIRESGASWSNLGADNNRGS